MVSLESDLHEPGGQGRVVHAGRRGGLGEPGARVEIAVGVDVDDVGYALG
jgi:hypothetical protein